MNVIRWFKVICLMGLAVCFVSCGNMYGDFAHDPDNAGVAQWATPIKSVSESGSSEFKGVAVDDAGNTYAVGFTNGGDYDFGGTSGFFHTGNSSSVIVKYNSEGVAQWAATPVSVSNYCSFECVAVDKQGNVFVVGQFQGSGGFNFGGKSVPFSGKSGGYNAIIVKYNSSGVVQWATPVNSAAAGSQFLSISLDAQGNSYAAGLVDTSDNVDFGGISTPVSGPGVSTSTVIVKYNTSGVAQWAKAIKSSSGESQFNGVAADASGNVYAVGSVTGIGEFDFVGGGDTKFNGKNPGYNAVIVKYSSSGDAQWSTPVKISSSSSFFNGAAVDRTGNIFAVGYASGSGNFDFGGDRGSFSGKNTGQNAVIVKYNSSGIAQWAGPVDTSSDSSIFNGVSVDVLGNVYAVGHIRSTGKYYFGGNTSSVNGTTKKENTVIVKYNEFGVAQWAKTVEAVESTKPDDVACEFKGVAVDSSGYSYAVGSLTEPGVFDFGGKSHPSSSGSGTNQYNTIIVKYY